ncbi:BamA/TamA family outer membrane protein [Parasphingopyxis sp. CP4]|uniref:autotransporter assembly complex protein TamA n=1 Tax=Parasphingopyxis sp. CP4 TaxID=2724527 RepID=UPI00159F7AF2|nr:BamA/TamA family outer membrane protein [Parasphingopyxis sp. CP4]QLC20973.1 BamA/TamA family outer membrane protein [Parasphingopyxis sp. CP4]
MTAAILPGRAFVGSLFILSIATVPFVAHAQLVPERATDESATGVDLLEIRDRSAVSTANGFDESAPMTEISDFSVAWPDMVDGSDAVTGGVDSGSISTQQRYSVSLRGLDGLEEQAEIRSQFNALSVLRENEDDRAVVAQINRRADLDRDLLDELLRSQGYYDAEVASVLSGETGSDEIEVVFEIDAGPLYRFDSVRLPGLAGAGERTDELRAEYPVEADDPVDAADVNTAEANLTAELGNRGYPFAVVGEEEVVIDHSDRTATLTVPVDTGGERDFGSIRVLQGENEIFGADHVAEIARFEPGDLYSTAMVDDLRRALVQTGLVSRVQLTPVESNDPGLVDLAVEMEPAPPRTISGEIGYSTGEGARVEVGWEHRNFFRPEGALALRGIIGTDDQFASVSIRRSNFLNRDQLLTAQLFAGNTNRDAFDARTAGVTASFERISNQLWQKQWIWSVGVELLASDERDVVGATGLRARETFLIGALPLSIAYDGTGDLLNPNEGARLSAFISPELSFQDGTFGYARVQIDGSAYYALLDALTLAGRVRLGAIPGASTNNIAPSRRFYAGGGGSVRGYSYQSIGPRDANNDPVGGRSLVEFALEARYRFGDFGVVPFIDAGAIYTDLYPDFTNLRFGAGLGVRYYSSFGPIRLDVGTPINPQPGDPVIAIYVSLGQAF